MSVTVVALLTPKPGKADDVLASFTKVSPLVHQEQGCELYAAHVGPGADGDVVIMVESWTTRADLDAHAAGAPLARLNELNAELLEKPYDVWFLRNVPLGDTEKGTIQLPPAPSTSPSSTSSTPPSSTSSTPPSN